jgi:hypothetical protein
LELVNDLSTRPSNLVPGCDIFLVRGARVFFFLVPSIKEGEQFIWR